MQRWKEKCDDYWFSRGSTDNYFWMDGLFNELYDTDITFRNAWNAVPYLSCEEPGSAHTFRSLHDPLGQDDAELYHLLEKRPPFAMKLWNWLNDKLSDAEPECNALRAIALSKRTNVVYPHLSLV